MWRCCSWLLLFACASGSLQRLCADEAPTPPTADELRSWAKDLDSDKYAARDAATRRLSAAGEAAIEPLIATAESGSREASARAFDLLAQLFKSPLAVTQTKAKAALEQLAKTDNAPVARRAAQVLQPEPPVPAAQVQRNFIPGQRGFGPGQRGIGRQGIQIIAGNQIRIGAGGNFQMQIVQNNNRRVVDANENGKQIHIEEDERGIDITLTEKVGDQQKVTAFGRKKNLDDLKKTEPEAAKLYEKYSGNGRNVAGAINNIQIQIQAQGGLPIPQPAPQIVPPAPAR